MKRNAETMSFRDFVAVQIMAAFATSDRRQDVEPVASKALAFMAVRWADALIEVLDANPESDEASPSPIAEKKPNPICDYCVGAWNGSDRWYVQSCICEEKCAEPACKANEKVEKEPSNEPTK